MLHTLHVFFHLFLLKYLVECSPSFFNLAGLEFLGCLAWRPAAFLSKVYATRSDVDLILQLFQSNTIPKLLCRRIHHSK